MSPAVEGSVRSGWHLLVVTVDGFAKRLPADDLPTGRRARRGVWVSSVPVAAAFEVGAAGQVVLASALGKVQRVAVEDVPVRRRRVLSGGMAKGARVMRLAAGDRVAAVACVPEQPDGPADVVAAVSETNAPGLRRQIGIALSVGETVAQVVAPVRSGGPARMLPRGRWEATAVHAASRYWCGCCGRELPDQHAVYGCLDRHAAAVA
jgi:hypothetical protein